MTKTKYAMITILGSVIISGLLWWQDGGVITAESPAEIMASIVEKDTVVNMSGTGDVVWRINLSHVVQIVETQEEFLTMTDNARELLYFSAPVDGKYANQISIDSYYPAPSYGPKYDSYWIDNVVNVYTDSLIVATATVEVYNVSDDYFFTTPSNASVNVSTVYDYITNGSSWSEFAISNRLVLADEFYSDTITYKPNFLPFGTTNNWWTYVGLGTNYSRFPYEYPRGREGDQCSTFIYKGRFALSNQVITIPYAEVYELDCWSSSVTNSGLFATLAYINPDESAGGNGFAITDNGQPFLLTLSDKTLSIERGDSGTIGISVTDWIWASNAVKRCSLSVVEWPTDLETVTVVPEYVDFTTNNYSTVTNFQIGVFDTWDNRTSAVLLRIEIDGKISTVAIKLTPAIGTPKPWDGLFFDPVILELEKSGTGTVDIAFNAVDTNIWYEVDSVISSNDYTDLKTQLSAMTRTITVCDYDAVDISNTVKYSYSISTNFFIEGNWQLFDAQDGVDYINGDLDDVVVTTNVSFWTGKLSWLDIDAVVGGNYFAITENEDATMYTDSTIANMYFMQGCSFDYPSDYAFESNYVSRIQIFAVATSSLADRIWNIETPGWARTQDPTQPDFYETNLKDTISDVLNIADITLPPNTINNEYVVSSSGEYSEIKLVRLLDVENPTNRPYFNMGTNVLNDFVLSEFQKEQGDYSKAPSGFPLLRDLGFRINLKHDNVVTVVKFAIITDYYWKHLNDDNPYLPQTNNPSWAE